MATTSLGPAPSPGAPALPAARARVASALAELGPDTPLTTLAERLGGHPNATRAQLDALVANGLATATPLRRHSPGRPALGWTLTEAGHRALAGDPTVTAYVELVGAMASALAELPDASDRARTIGRAWARTHDPAESPEAVVEVLDGLGFSPELADDTLRLRTCPLLDAASAYPQVVCSIHAGIIDGTVGHQDSVLEAFAEPGACVVHHLRPRARG